MNILGEITDLSIGMPLLNGVMFLAGEKSLPCVDF